VWGGVAVTLIDTAGLRATDDPLEQRGIALGEARVASADVVVVVNDGAAAGQDGQRYGARAVLVRSKADLDAGRDDTEAARGAGASPSSLVAGAGGAGSPSSVGAGLGAGAGAEGSPSSVGAGRGAGASPSPSDADADPRVGTHGEPSLDATGQAILATSATTGQGLDELRRRVLTVAGVADREGSEQAFVTTARQHALAGAARDAFVAALAARRERRPPEVVAIELRDAVRSLAQLRGVEVGERVLDEVFARFCIGK
jgi:tRNA modification GTPase